MAKILALGGDGIGPEILDQGLRIIDVLAVPAGLDVEIETGLLHGASYEASLSVLSAALNGMASGRCTILIEQLMYFFILRECAAGRCLRASVVIRR